ncbi:HET-domain-containing protein, partial [Setomelanomma holmii]
MSIVTGVTGSTLALYWYWIRTHVRSCTSRSFSILTSFTDTVGPPTQQDLSLSTRYDPAIAFLLGKYRECCANHDQCNASRSPNPDTFPSRLLDVGTEEGSLVILVSGSLLQNLEYVCLSHCWGKTKPFTLNAATQSRLGNGIQMTDLPRTFQDAIYITRRLAIRYLWIDCLCILQDDVSDWAIESSRMSHVYALAACTIAATASEDCDGGLFFDRDPAHIYPIHLDVQFKRSASWLEDKVGGFPLLGSYLCDLEYMAEIDIENSPLNMRAWVCQERQLSRRILHFGKRQLFWECYTCTSCETYPEELPRWALPYWYDDPTMLKRQLHNRIRQKKALYWAWCSFRVKYSQCGLSRDSDKLVAIRGIAREVGKVTGDDLVAGLWRGRMIEELCWFKRRFSHEPPAVEPEQWRAPTWSWASSNAKIWTS